MRGSHPRTFCLRDPCGNKICALHRGATVSTRNTRWRLFSRQASAHPAARLLDGLQFSFGHERERLLPLKIRENIGADL